MPYKDKETQKEYGHNRFQDKWYNDPEFREHKNLINKRWRENNPQKCREYSRKNYWKHRDEILKNNREKAHNNGVKPIIEHPMNKLTDIQIGYIAGIVDGEGHIGITTRKSEKGGARYVSFFNVVNTDKTALETIRNILGCGSVLNHSKQIGNCKLSYSINFSSNATRDILTAIEPYLLIKRKQAQILLQFLNDMRKSNGHYPYPKELLIPLFNEIKRLNHRGIR